MSFAYRRQGASFLLSSTASLPATVDLNLGGVVMEVSDLGTVGTVTTGAEAVPVTAPTEAQQVCRYRFIPSETVTIVDQTATGLNGTVVQYFGAGLYAAAGQPSGAYGIRFFGINLGSDRAHFTIANNAKFGAQRTRFIFGLRPEPFGDLTQTYGTIVRAQGAGGNIWSLVRGTDNTLFFGTGSANDGINTANALQIRGFFTDNEFCTVELEIDGLDIRIWKNNVLVSDDYTMPAAVDWTAATLRVGNQGNAGGGPFWGHMSHMAAYTGDLTDGEVRWIRDTAKTMIETAPKILTVPTPPAPRPVGQLSVTRAPSFSSKIYSLQNQPVSFREGRASDGLGGPIAQSFTLTLGGSNVKPARGFTLLPASVGDLVLTSLFDNALHPAQSSAVTLPILQAFPALSAAEIKTRLGNVGNVFIDDFDAGFPADMIWRPSMIVDPGDGTIGLRLLPNNGAGRPNLGGSAQFLMLTDTGSNTPGVAAQIFTIDCRFQLVDTRAPGLAKGYIQTFFTFTNPFTVLRREIDFEFNSQTGYMECTLHLAPVSGGSSAAISILFAPPEASFTGQRKWTITGNADRIEWFYEDTLITRYIRGVGFDNTVQNYTLYSRNSTNGAVTLFGPSSTFIHPNDAGWHVAAQNGFIQNWMSNQQTGWIGPNTVPLNQPVTKFGATTAQAFGPANTNLLVGNWTATAIGGGQVRVNVSSYRPARFVPNFLEARVDGGSWVRLAGTTGNQTISGVATGSRNIELRPVAEAPEAWTGGSRTYTMNANVSDTKTVPVT